MMEELAAWSSRCDSVLGDLEAEIAKVRADAAKRRKEELRVDRQVKAVTEAGEKGAAGGPLGASRAGHNTRGTTRRDYDDDDEDGMEIDGGGMGGKKRSGGGGGAFGGLMGRFGGRPGGR